MKTILADVKQCIYCHTKEGKLSEEHIVPYGLNGVHTLLNASCKKCADITSRIEGKVLRESFISARQGLNFRSRHQKAWNLPMDAFTGLFFPISPPPAHLTGEAYESGVKVKSIALFALMTRHSKTKVRTTFPGHNFQRMLAKIGLGFAVAKYGIDAFQEFYVLPAILGEREDVGRWVGTAEDKIMPIGKFHYDTRGRKSR